MENLIWISGWLDCWSDWSSFNIPKTAPCNKLEICYFLETRHSEINREFLASQRGESSSFPNAGVNFWKRKFRLQGFINIGAVAKLWTRTNMDIRPGRSLRRRNS